MARHSGYSSDPAGTCTERCEECADECDRFDHEHCQVCAEKLQDCAAGDSRTFSYVPA